MFSRSNGQAVLLREDSSLRINWAWFRRGAYLLGVAAVLGWLLYTANDPQTLPVKKISAVGTFVHVDEKMLHDAVAGTLDGGYFRMDMQKIKQVVETIPWIDKASIRRVWPDTLAIEITEQTVLAQWANGGLVNMRGEIFSPEKSSYPVGLPIFSGQTGMEQKLTDYFKSSQQIFTGLDLVVTEIHMDARRAVSLRLSNGIDVILGREQIEARMQRFARIYKKVLAERVNEIARVDLRYSNGLAVGWRGKTPVHQG